MAVKIRVVAYSPSRGVWMGMNKDNTAPEWSKDPGIAATDTAFTFQDEAHFKSVCKEYNVDPPTDVEMRQVPVVTGPGNSLTVNDAGDCLLPRWGD